MQITYRLEPDYCLPVDYMQKLLKGGYDTILEEMGVAPDAQRTRELYGKSSDHAMQERVCEVVVEAYVREVMLLRLCWLDLDANELRVCGHRVPCEPEVREMLRFLGVADEEILSVDISVLL